MDEREKIENIMQVFNLNSAQFANEIRIQSSTLSHILNGRNKPSSEVLKKILNRFKNISPDWLILDEGSMFRNTSNSHEPTLFDEPDINNCNTEIYTSVSPTEIKSEKSDFQSEIVNKSDFQDLTPEVKTNDKESIIEFKSSNREIKSIIVYYSDNTFQEFEPR